jgi:hypothetical protein
MPERRQHVAGDLLPLQILSFHDPSFSQAIFSTIEECVEKKEKHSIGKNEQRGEGEAQCWEE